METQSIETYVHHIHKEDMKLIKEIRSCGIIFWFLNRRSIGYKSADMLINEGTYIKA